MESKFSVSFIGKKSCTTKQHLLPIYLRVTINGNRFEVATHQHVKSSQWLPSAGKAIGRSVSINQVNTELDLIKKKVYNYKDRLQIEEREFTVKSIRQKWFGQDRNTRTLLEARRLNILDLQQLVRKGVYKKSTLTKYITSEKHLINYLKWRNIGSDILLIDLRHELI
jgi:hypothetical protein